MDELIDRILRISNEKEGKSLLEMTLKCSEELGEVSEAVLSYNGVCGCGYKGKTIDDVNEEIIDVFIVIVAMAAKAGLSKEQMIPIIEKKLNKWQKVIDR
jgi:NTP pyrophosphatase (non-canonical NTP hydrolase)